MCSESAALTRQYGNRFMILSLFLRFYPDPQQLGHSALEHA